MTGFDGGTNFGDSLSFPATRRHGDVDRNPEIEKKLRPSCFSSVSCKHKGYACYFFLERLFLALAPLAQSGHKYGASNDMSGKYTVI